MDKGIQFSSPGPTVYALKPEFYELKTPGGFLDGLNKAVKVAHWQANRHLDAKNAEGHGRIYKVTHIVLAIFEFIPGVGHIVALFEMVVVRGTRHFFPLDLPKLVGKKEDEEQQPEVTPGSDTAAHIKIQLEDDQATQDSNQETPPPSDQEVVIVEIPVAIDDEPNQPREEEPCSDATPPPFCPASSSYDLVPPSSPAATTPSSASVTTRNLSPPRFKGLVRRVIVNNNAKHDEVRNKFMGIVIFAAQRQLQMAQTAKPAREYTAFENAVLGAVSWCNWVSGGVSFVANLEQSKTMTTLYARLTEMAPSLAQLFPEQFEALNKQVLCLTKPLFYLFPAAAKYNAQAKLHRMVREGAGMAPQGEQMPPQDGVTRAVSTAFWLGKQADAAYDEQYYAQTGLKHVFNGVQNTLAGLISRPALSEENAKELAQQVTGAMQKTIQETLASLSQGDDKPVSDAARFFAHSPMIRSLGFFGDAFLIEMIKTGLLELNTAVNKEFVRSQVVNAAGNVVVSIVMDNYQNSITVPPEALEAVQFLTSSFSLASSGLDAAQIALLHMHILQYVKHLFVLQNALTRTGGIDFKLILASKGDQGDKDVVQAVTAICSIIGRRNKTLTATIENGLRNVLAMWELAQHLGRDEQDHFAGAMIKAMEEDGIVSNATSNLVQSKLNQMMGDVVKWWKTPPSESMNELKRVISDAAQEAATVRVEAPGNHLEQAAIEAGQRALDVSKMNCGMALGVRAPAVYWKMTSGDILGALFNTGMAVAVQVTVGFGKDKGVEAGVKVVSPDQWLATFVTQFCMVKGRVQQHLDSQLNKPSNIS